MLDQPRNTRSKSCSSNTPVVKVFDCKQKIKLSLTTPQTISIPDAGWNMVYYSSILYIAYSI